MPNKYRNRSTSTWMHVYNRGADKQDIFSLDGDREIFEHLMGERALDHGIEIHAYALMTNHFHMLVHVLNEGLGDFMHRLCGAYAMGYNERTKRTGPLFTGRYSSVPVLNDRQQVWSGRYIHLNPLGIVPASALATYRYSSLACYLGRRQCPEWLVLHGLASQQDAHFMTDGVLDEWPEDRVPFESFAPLRQTTSDELAAAIAAAVSPDSVARRLEMTLALELRTGTVSDIAAHFSVSEESLRRAARRGRVLLDTDPSFSALRTSVLSELHAA